MNYFTDNEQLSIVLLTVKLDRVEYNSGSNWASNRIASTEAQGCPIEIFMSTI